MTWERVEREDVRLGDTIRLVVPTVLAIAEGADGRPAFGYAQDAITVERWAPDVLEADEVGAALAEARITDHRRGVPLADLHVRTQDDGDVFVAGRIPAGSIPGVDLAHLSLVRPDVVDEQIIDAADGRVLWRRGGNR